jgi:hypothetical protein
MWTLFPLLPQRIAAHFVLDPGAEIRPQSPGLSSGIPDSGAPFNPEQLENLIHTPMALEASSPRAGEERQEELSLNVTVSS